MLYWICQKFKAAKLKPGKILGVLIIFSGLFLANGPQAQAQEAPGRIKISKHDWKMVEAPSFDFYYSAENQGFFSQSWDMLAYSLNKNKVRVALIKPSSPEEKELQRGTDYTLVNSFGRQRIELMPSVLTEFGQYALKVRTIKGGEEVSFVQDFTWGILAINTNKSIYTPGEEAILAMAVLDAKGNMVCDAKVELRIRNAELGIEEILSTENGKITVNAECRLKGFTLKPDYSARYQTQGAGNYALTLMAETSQGTFVIADNFAVQEKVAFAVERITATRIYPVKKYPVVFNITANEDFTGEIRETVPKSFEVTNQELRIKNQESEEFTIHNSQFVIQDNAHGSKDIIFQDINIKKDDKIEISYQFDAPDVSPDFYLLGPLSFWKNEFFFGASLVFAEARKWQLAIDATVTTAGNGNWNSTTPDAPWPGGTVPAATDDVVIRPVDAVTLTADAAINSINLQGTLNLGSSGYTLTLGGSGTGTSRPLYLNGGTLNEGTNSTVKYTGTTATDIQTENYSNLEMSPSGGTNPTCTLMEAGGGTEEGVGTGGNWESNGTPTNINDASDFGDLQEASRQVVRDSSGNLYAVLLDDTNDDLEVWKSTDGTSWSEQDSGNSPAATIANSNVAAAIDGNNTLHIIYQTGDGYDVYYVTFSGTSFGTPEIAYDGTSSSNRYDPLDITVDSANKPHIVMQHVGAVGGIGLRYGNKTGASWSTYVEVKSDFGGSTFFGVSMSIDEDNIPQISYVFSDDSDLIIKRGNQNDATNFDDSAAPDTSVNTTSGQAGSSIAVDTDGNTWVAYVDITTNYITLAKHTHGAAWSAWDIYSDGASAGYEPSIALNGSDVYVFYYKYSGYDVVYQKYNGSWTSQIIIANGTIDFPRGDAKAKWSFNFNNQGDAQIDYLYSYEGIDVYWNKLTFEDGYKINDASDFGDLQEASRQVVRDSSGNLYAVLLDDTNDDLEVWKSTDGTSWTEQDAGNSPAATIANSNVAVAIDGNNTLHIAYTEVAATYRSVYYATFSGSSFVVNEVAYAGAANDTFGEVAIAVDSNNKPHIIMEHFGSTNVEGLKYGNKIGASWSSPVTVVADGSLDSYTNLSITIDEDDIPQINFLGDDGGSGGSFVERGNQNNATSFPDSYGFSNSMESDIAVDSAGNTWVTYASASTNITLAKHTHGAAWSAWDTYSDGTSTGREPSIAINGTDVYIFYKDDSDNDIKYLKYDGSWTGPTLLAEGTFQDAKAKWSFNFNNQSSTQIDLLYSDNTDVFWNKLIMATAGADSLTIAGNLTVNDGSGTEAVTIDATTNDPSITVGGNLTLNNYTTWTKSDSATLTFNGATTPVTWTDSNGTKQDMGLVTIDGDSKVVNTGSGVTAEILTIGADDSLNITDDTLTLTGTGTPLVQGGTFTTSGSTVIYTGTTTATNIATTRYNNLTLTPSGATTYNLTGDLTSTNDLTGNLTISANATLDNTAANKYDLEVGGNWANAGTFTHNSGGTVTFDAAATGKTINTGGTAPGQTFYDIAFNNSAGGWTLQTNDIKITHDLTLTDVNDWTLSAGKTLEINGAYNIEDAETAATTWGAGSVLYLNGTSQTIGSKNQAEEDYATLQIGNSTDIKIWNSSAATYTVDSAGSLYSMDHANADGDLYIWGDYHVTGGDYWSYAKDFDNATVARTVDVRLDPAAKITVDSGDTLNAVGTAANRTTIDRQGLSGGYEMSVLSGGTINLTYADFDHQDGPLGLDIQAGAAVSSLNYMGFDNLVGSGATNDAYITVAASVIEAANKLFPGVVFAETDASVEFNVNRLGDATGYWTFYDASGALAGEDYDGYDGGADPIPGMIRWEDPDTSGHKSKLEGTFNFDGSVVFN